MYSLNKIRRPLVTCDGDVWLQESNHRNFVLSVFEVQPCFLYEDTLLHAMSKLLNVQFHIVTKDFSYTLSSSERTTKMEFRPSVKWSLRG